MYSTEMLEIIGKSLIFDFLYVKGACTNVWNWIIDTWTIQKWNPKWDITSKVWDTTWDTKGYDEAYCDVNFLDISHEKMD